MLNKYEGGRRERERGKGETKEKRGSKGGEKGGKEERNLAFLSTPFKNLS